MVKREYNYKNLIFPIIWQIIFILSITFSNENYYVYSNFLFYLGISIYFIKLGYFNISELKANIKSGRIFWNNVLLASILFVLSFLLGDILAKIFNIDNINMINLKVNNYFELILFSFSTILLPPIAEELFYRKAIIHFKNNKILFITAAIGVFLYAIEHSLSALGVLQAMIWAIPFTIIYIKTKNIYINIVAHFLVNLIVNGSTVIFSFIKLFN